MSDLTRLYSKVTSANGWMKPYLEIESELAALVQSEVTAEKFEAAAIEASKKLDRAKDEYLKVAADIESKKRAAAADHERAQAERAKGAEAVEALQKGRAAQLEAAYAAKSKELGQQVDATQAALAALRADKESLEAEVARLSEVRDSLRKQLSQVGGV